MSAIVGIAAGRRRHSREDRHLYSRQHPGTLARGEARRQQPVIDLACDCEAVESRWRQEEACVVREAVGRGVDIALRRGDDAVVIPRYPLHLGGVGIEQALLRVSHIRLKRSQSLVDVKIDFIGETTGDAALAKLALRIDIAVEIIWEAAGERQFVKWVDPVGAEIVELPV